MPEPATPTIAARARIARCPRCPGLCVSTAATAGGRKTARPGASPEHPGVAAPRTRRRGPEQTSLALAVEPVLGTSSNGVPLVPLGEGEISGTLHVRRAAGAEVRRRQADRFPASAGGGVGARPKGSPPVVRRVSRARPRFPA